MEARIRLALDAAFGPEAAEAATLDNLGGHASLRIYWRVHLPGDPGDYPRGEGTRMAMVLPKTGEVLRSEEGSSSSAPSPTELPFVDVQRYLDGLGVRVPAVDFVDMGLGVLLLEDLGSEEFETAWRAADSDEARDALYREVIDVLVGFQGAVHAEDQGDGERQDCICWLRSFDEELLRWELDHYVEWGLEAQYGEDIVAAPIRDELDEIFTEIVAELRALPQTLVLRDYQSRNLMRKTGPDGAEEWVVIDFQDALVGPAIYDLVALLRDSYIELEPATVERLVAHYDARGAEAGLPWCGDLEATRRAFHLQTVQRKLKDAGRFIYIDRIKQNPGFLPYYEPSIGYVKNALEALPEHARLRELLAKVEARW